MMDFVRRLAPGGGNERGRALPALPSRMLGRAPIRSGALDLGRADENDEEEDLDLGGLPPAAGESSTPRPPTSRRTRTTPQLDPARDAFESADATRGVAEERSATANRVADGPLRAVSGGARPLAPDPPPSKASHLKPQSQPALDRDGAPVRKDARRHGADSATQARAASTLAPPPQAIGTPPRRVEPLSAPALKARIAAPAPAVVHVHIDRIDLRLPGAGPASAASPRKAAPRAGAVSLADYLQARATGARGAAR